MGDGVDRRVEAALDGFHARQADSMADRMRAALAASDAVDDRDRDWTITNIGDPPGWYAIETTHIRLGPFSSREEAEAVVGSSGAVSQGEEDPDLAEQIRIGRLGLPDPDRPRRRSLPGFQPSEPQEDRT